MKLVVLMILGVARMLLWMSNVLSKASNHVAMFSLRVACWSTGVDYHKVRETVVRQALFRYEMQKARREGLSR